MNNLSATQNAALSRLSYTKPMSAYTLRVGIRTLEALVNKGYAKEINAGRVGHLFSPATHRHFIRTTKGVPGIKES